MTSHARRAVLCAVVLVALLVAGACGGSDESAMGRVDTQAPDVVAPGDTGNVTPDVTAPADGAPEAQDDAQGADAFAEDVPPFNYACEPGTVEACVTACRSAGKRMCLKEWGPCVPPEEFCGNCADDDCDGLVNEGCAPLDGCDPVVEPGCPVAVITVTEGTSVGVGTTLHLSAEQSVSDSGAIVRWSWSVVAPAGSASGFVPSADVQSPTFLADVAGQYLFSLDVWDGTGTQSCARAQMGVAAAPYPPLVPEIGCADGEREGYLDVDAHAQIAGCAGAWEEPGVTPDTVAPTCGRQAGDDGDLAEGTGCASADLCAAGWHVCVGWHEVAAKSPTGCAGATPPDAGPKSLFFAIRQPSENNSVCGAWGDGFNDVFGCGNLGHTLPSEKGCGPLDRVLASTQPNSCGFNEAEPPHGPWECLGLDDSHLNEGALVTKKGCAGTSCSYDGNPIGNADKGGVLCCRNDGTR